MAVTLITEPSYEDVLAVAANMREIDRAEIFATRWNDSPEQLAADVVGTGAFRWGAYVDGTPVGMIGALPRWPGVWSAWAFGTDRWKEAALTITRHARNFMFPAIKNSGAHRIDAMSLQNHKEAHSWLELFGAIPEKTLDKYGKNGETFLCYAWTR